MYWFKFPFSAQAIRHLSSLLVASQAIQTQHYTPLTPNRTEGKQVDKEKHTEPADKTPKKQSEDEKGPADTSTTQMQKNPRQSSNSGGGKWSDAEQTGIDSTGKLQTKPQPGRILHREVKRWGPGKTHVSHTHTKHLVSYLLICLCTGPPAEISRLRVSLTLLQELTTESPHPSPVCRCTIHVYSLSIG